MERRSRGYRSLGLLLACLVGFSVFLALNRIYQVDECQNLFMARVIGTGQSERFFTNAPLWHMGPLACLARAAQSSVDLFTCARLIFLVLFWVNISLITLNTGIRLRSLKGLAVLLAAATLTPLWDYGFEIRHDNLILTGLLLLWWVGRRHPMGLSSSFFLGFLAVLLQFIAFKAFVYVLPLMAVLVLLHRSPGKVDRSRLALVCIGGALLALLCCRLAYQVSGLWPSYLAGFQGGLEASGNGSRFGPSLSLGRLLTQTPLLLALTVAAIIGVGQELHRRGKTALSSEGAAPEALLFLAMLGAFLVNPTPFPYNLVNLVPFAFLVSFRFLGSALLDPPRGPSTLALAGGILCFTHVVPFATATWRHLDWNNDRQGHLMRMAEALTDPARDAVYDAIGMVPTRHSIHFRWYLHSLNIRTFIDGKEQGIQQLLAANPPAVIIPSYRTDWLRKEDWTFIQSRYLPMADDFWVLGQVLPPGGGSSTIVHPGRYLLLSQRDGHIAPLSTGILDGRAIEKRPVALSLGTHQLSCPPDIRPVFIWIGPQLQDLPELGQGDHQRLFVNWY